MIKIIVISLFVFAILMVNNLIMNLLTGVSFNRSITYFLHPFQVGIPLIVLGILLIQKKMGKVKNSSSLS